ncbi:penicillin-binding protein activator [Luteimonas aestuarii]|nr:penicillin-binding protein activator [Luteimonas aestuarii]
MSAKRIPLSPVLAALLLSLAGCASVQVAQPTATEVVEDAGPGTHWTFDETRPPAESDGYRPPRKLAVLLPMTGSLATAAGSVRDGLLAGYYGERRPRPELAFYDTTGTASGASAALARALSEGADQVLGPLGREEVVAIASSPSAQPIVTLNSSDATLGTNVAAFGLSPEDEGRAIGNYLSARNARRVLVLSSGDDGANRSVNALRAVLQADGGEIVDTLAVVGETPGDLTSALRASASREGGVDAVVLALRGNQARLVAPQLAAAGLSQRLRIATAQITSGTGKAEEDRALDGIVFPSEAWVVGGTSALPNAATLGRDLPTARGPAARLFAFGHDAWLLSGWLYHLASNPTARINGATGQLGLQADGTVVRQPAWATFSGGAVVAQRD